MKNIKDNFIERLFRLSFELFFEIKKYKVLNNNSFVYFYGDALDISDPSVTVIQNSRLFPSSKKQLFFIGKRDVHSVLYPSNFFVGCFLCFSSMGLFGFTALVVWFFDLKITFGSVFMIMVIGVLIGVVVGCLLLDRVVFLYNLWQIKKYKSNLISC